MRWALGDAQNSASAGASAVRREGRLSREKKKGDAGEEEVDGLQGAFYDGGCRGDGGGSGGSRVEMLVRSSSGGS